MQVLADLTTAECLEELRNLPQRARSGTQAHFGGKRRENALGIRKWFAKNFSFQS